MPNPFNQSDYQEKKSMPIPPPKKKPMPIPPKRHDYTRKEPRQNGLRFQPNRTFESIEEIKTWAAFTYPKKKVSIISTWETTSISCQIEVEQ